MKEIKLIFFLFIAFFFLSVFSAELEEIPSAELRDSIRIDSSHSDGDILENMESDASKRRKLFTNAWVGATQVSRVDNRSYLFSLAIDLYNSIPSDLMPEPRERGPGGGVNELELKPIKEQLRYQMMGLDPKFEKTLKEKQDRWEYMKRRFPSERHPAIIELKYLTNYLTEQIKKGNIVLDAHDAPASLPPEKLDITNPTYYESLREHMDRMQPAIEAGVPPWEAKKYLETEQNDEKLCMANFNFRLEERCF